MRTYDFSIHNKTVKRDKSRYFTYAFIILLLGVIVWFASYVVLNSPSIMYYFRENKYSGIEKAHSQAMAVIEKASGADSESLLETNEVIDFLELAHTLQKSHNEDPILYYHEAIVLSEILRKQIHAKGAALIFIFFRDFIEKTIFPSDYDHTLWQRVILLGRQARALGLPDVLQEKLKEAQIDAYLIGGRPWWESALEFGETPSVRKTPAWQLIQAGLARETPNFELIKAAYGHMLLTFVKACYYLRSGNSPLGISNLREVAKNPSDAAAKDAALYMLGYLSGRDKRVKEQLAYYQDIRFKEFQPKNPFFVDEYQYLLRFTGQKSEADQLVRAWEELSSQNKE
ncbi:MAG: hypothetical protein LDLANPLL_01108 [Turneriella sp.]|nr:hypothetical protein [Turneriella sp.]